MRINASRIRELYVQSRYLLGDSFMLFSHTRSIFLFANNAKYRKQILPKYRRVRAKPKWKKLSRKDGNKSRHVAWAQLLWRSFGVMGFVCQHCGCLMRLRAVAIYPPATTKILRGLGVNLHGLGFTGPP